MSARSSSQERANTSTVAAADEGRSSRKERAPETLTVHAAARIGSTGATGAGLLSEGCDARTQPTSTLRHAQGSAGRRECDYS